MQFRIRLFKKSDSSFHTLRLELPEPWNFELRTNPNSKVRYFPKPNFEPLQTFLKKNRTELWTLLHRPAKIVKVLYTKPNFALLEPEVRPATTELQTYWTLQTEPSENLNLKNVLPNLLRPVWSLNSEHWSPNFFNTNSKKKAGMKGSQRFWLTTWCSYFLTQWYIVHSRDKMWKKWNLRKPHQCLAQWLK